MNAIEVKNFRKQFDSVAAIKGINLKVRQGELFGIIGPDGAGKTTLMRSICTLLKPDEGCILIEQLDTSKHISEIRSLLGYMPQRFSLYQDLSVEQNLRFFADIFQVTPESRKKRLKELYRFSRLEPFKKRTAGALSGGMKQKLALSCALIHTPDILILDEPTYGVDPVSRKEFWEILKLLQEGGITILVATAYMEEADLCDRVALLSQGHIAALDTPQQLKAGYSYPSFTLQGKDLRRLRQFFQKFPFVQMIQLFGDTLHISFKKTPEEFEWRQWQKESHFNLTKWKPHLPSIEDVFLDVMNKNANPSSI